MSAFATDPQGSQDSHYRGQFRGHLDKETSYSLKPAGVCLQVGQEAARTPSHLHGGAGVQAWELSTSLDLGFTICDWPRSMSQMGQMVIKIWGFGIRLHVTACPATS